MTWFGQVQRYSERLEKDDENKAARQEAKRNDKQEIYECRVEGRAGGWRDRGRCRGQGEMMFRNISKQDRRLAQVMFMNNKSNKELRLD